MIVFLPVLISLLLQGRLISVPRFKRVVEEFIVEQIQSSIDDLESFGINIHLAAVIAHSIRAPASVLRFILRWIFFECIQVSLTGKTVEYALIRIGVLTPPFQCSSVGEVAHGIISLDGGFIFFLVILRQPPLDRDLRYKRKYGDLQDAYKSENFHSPKLKLFRKFSGVHLAPVGSITRSSNFRRD